MTFTFAADFGDITVGEQVSFSVAGSESARAFLPVEACRVRDPRSTATAARPC